MRWPSECQFCTGGTLRLNQIRFVAVRSQRLEGLARYAKHNADFVLVVSGSLEAERTKKLIEIVYDLLIKAIELGSFALLEFGVRPVGLK